MGEHLPASVAARIRLVLLDVDGVLTDGGLFIGRTGDGQSIELKRFEITDGLGIKMLASSGIGVVMLSGRESAASRMRAHELGIEIIVGDGGYKLALAEDVMLRHGVSWEGTACVCDDLADLPLLRRAGLAVAVRDAVPEVRAAAHWRTERSGGHGAVREFAEALLRARGVWTGLVERYCREREAGVPG